MSSDSGRDRVRTGAADIPGDIANRQAVSAEVGSVGWIEHMTDRRPTRPLDSERMT